MLPRLLICSLLLALPGIGCAALLTDSAKKASGDDDDSDDDGGPSEDGSPKASSSGGSSSGRASSSSSSSSGSTSSSSGTEPPPPSTELWPLEVGAAWLLTGGSGANSEIPCTESYTVTGLAEYEGRQAYAVAVDWCDLTSSTEHYAKGSAADSLDHYVGGAWVTLYRGPVELDQGFDVGSDHFRWKYGQRPAGDTGSDTDCWRLQLPLSSNRFLMEFCRGLGLVRIVRDAFDAAHDVDVSFTSYTPPGVP